MDASPAPAPTAAPSPPAQQRQPQPTAVVGPASRGGVGVGEKPLPDLLAGLMDTSAARPASTGSHTSTASASSASSRPRRGSLSKYRTGNAHTNATSEWVTSPVPQASTPASSPEPQQATLTKPHQQSSQRQQQSSDANSAGHQRAWTLTAVWDSLRWSGVSITGTVRRQGRRKWGMLRSGDYVEYVSTPHHICRVAHPVTSTSTQVSSAISDGQSCPVTHAAWRDRGQQPSMSLATHERASPLQ